jgi:hypothetical protein
MLARAFQLLLIWGTIASAQSNTTASLNGVITDPSKAVIPTARLKITNQDTAEGRSVDTDQHGEYHFLRLSPGSYDLTVEMEGFATQHHKGVVLTVGADVTLDLELSLGGKNETVVVTSEARSIEALRSYQANTLEQAAIRNLPINRRDYLTFVLLAPGVADSKALADGTSFRVKQTPDSGLSFYGSNGRGNSVSVDGGEANDAGGGVRPTVSQEVVQEFQVDRANYSAEYGASRGGVINIITKSGSNFLRGSVFGFFRQQSLDAGNPFALALQDDRLVRVKPDSNRQQFGASLGGPLKANRTFFFAGYEQLRRREATAVPVLTSFSIFQPTRNQEAVLQQLPAAQAAPLRAALTSPPSTVSMFEQNSGVFPFQTDSHQGLWRIDHRINDANQLNIRYNVSAIHDTNQNVAALVGLSRGYVQDFLDNTAMASWTHLFSPAVVNEARVQYNYNDALTASNDPFGPALEIAGYGFFNRDRLLPSDIRLRREELAENIHIRRAAHSAKIGAYVLIRQDNSDSKTFLGGRFTFGPLPGAFVSPALAGVSINALQAFNLGLAQSYQQGFGDPVVHGVYPLYAGYAQDAWSVGRGLTLNFGLRYELDERKAPLRTSKKDFQPRFGFSWDLSGSHKTVVRGGYGLFFAAIDFQIDYVATAFSVLNGRQQIAQVLTTLSPSNPLAITGPVNIFSTLRAQGVIGVPAPLRSIQESDLRQFGIAVTHTAPLAPLSVVIRNSPDYTNPYAQQASFEIEREIGSGLVITAGTAYVRGVHLTTSRDDNLLPAPVNPLTGIRDWGVTANNPTGTKYFKNPLLFQDDVYESTANSWYNGLTLEARKRFGKNFLVLNYTFSKAMDETVDFNTDFEPSDQTCRRCEHALSSFDQRHKVVVYANLSTAAGVAPIRKFTEGLQFAPIFRYNSARPFNLLAGTELNNDRHNTTDRPFFAGRNTGIGPGFWTLDTRLSRELKVRERVQLNLMFEAFNLLNRLNYSGVNNTVGNTPGPFRVTGRSDRIASEPLGFTSAADSRRMQLGLRFSF